MCYLEAVSRRISVPLVSLKLHRQICRAETYFEGLSSDEQLGFIFKQVALKCSLKRTTSQHNVKYLDIFPLMLFSVVSTLHQNNFSKRWLKYWHLCLSAFVLIVIPSELIPLVRGIFPLYYAALAEFESPSSSVLPEVVKAREKNSCLVSEGMPCQLSCEIHTSKQDNLFHPGQISYPGMEMQIVSCTKPWPNRV